ncbi:MAG: PHP domain-containing protein [Bacillota bacterium]
MPVVSISIHNHTVLSPCAGLMMTPGNIMAAAARLDIEIIGITDHNSAANLEAAQSQAEKYNVTLLPGLEVTTKEDIHLLIFLSEVEEVLKISEIINHNLNKQGYNPEKIGYQIIVNHEDEFVDEIAYYLPAAVDLSLQELEEMVIQKGGIVIPAHVTRSQGILKTLGFVPIDSRIKLLEITGSNEMKSLEKYNIDQEMSLIKSTDTHHIKDLKSVQEINLPESFTGADIIQALKNI